MVEIVIQIKSGITINVDASAKIRENIMCAKKITFGILVHVLVKMVNMLMVKYYLWFSNYVL